MRIKRQSKPKIASEKQLNLTVTGRMFDRQIKQPKLPPLNSTFRRSMIKFPAKKQTESRKETQATLNQSSLFQSYYNNTSKNWIKPSDYIKDIKQLNLLSEQEDADISKYQINLKEGNSKNLQKIQSLFELVEKWISIIKKAIFYITSLKTTSDKLIQQVKFWKALSKKFDELQYEFNDKKIVQLVNLMKRIVKTHPDHRKKLQQFIQLKEKAIQMTHPVKKIYMSLQESVVGNLQKLEVNSNIGQSLDLLKKILLGFQGVAAQNNILQPRMEIVYRKMDLCLIQKLLAAPLYPHELAHISSLKEKYAVIDKALSFYSHFLSILEEQEKRQLQTIIQNASYTQSVLINLLQILSFLEYLYHKKDVYQFSYLSTNNIQYNIYEITSKQLWLEYMAKVEKSMEKNKFQP